MENKEQMYRHLTAAEQQQLTAQQCTADNWDNILVVNDFNPHYINNTDFSGAIKIGHFEREFELPGGLRIHSGISHARIHNCEIGNDVHLYNIHNYIANYRIGDRSCIENVNAILVDEPTTFGNGVRVSVMNEGGGREIPIFDKLSAPLAYMLTFYRHRPEMIQRVEQWIDDYATQQTDTMGTIGEDVCILNCGTIKDVRIGDCAQLMGLSRLKNGSINSNRLAPVKIGSGVKCVNFIISSGVRILDSTIVDTCFVGQGCVFDKHYSAEHSLFFSNCQGMHGEACAIFAGPFTVTHHKSTLLIAGMFSFLNAGSGSNQSNHMYKLGPIHQGVVERGAKTTSDSYMLWPSKVGAFSLVMGRHTHHADTSALPFSYLIENNSETYIVPGANLRTVGTIRDAQKWPKRDLRTDTEKLDFINYNLLSPYTVQKMWHGRDVLNELQTLSGKKTEIYGYNNCKIRNTSLLHGIELYSIGIAKFLGNSLISRIEKADIHTLSDLRKALQSDTQVGLGDWVDLAGLIAPRSEVSRLIDDIEQHTLSLNDIQQRFAEMHTNYYSYEWTWALDKLQQIWGCTAAEVSLQQVLQTIDQWQDAVVELDNRVYEDARKEFDLNSQTGFGVDGDAMQQQADFESVRGRFESNAFVMAVKEHIRKKTALGEQVRKQLQNIR